MIKTTWIFYFIVYYTSTAIFASEPISNCTLKTGVLVGRTSSVQCTNVTSLTELNIEFPIRKIEALMITDSRISKISSNTSLDQYSSMDLLIMDDLGIEKIEPEALRRCRHLTTLSLKNNQIGFIPARAFGEKLSSLDLRNNVISNIDPEAFSGMINLKFVYMSKNRIKHLGEGLFKDCPNLRNLDFSYNSIETLDPKIFENLELLNSVDLSYNRITTIADGLFKDSHILEHLNISHNQIEHIPSHVFSDARNFWNFELVASSNKLEYFRPEIFTDNFSFNPQVEHSFDFRNNSFTKNKIEAFLGEFVKLNHCHVTMKVTLDEGSCKNIKFNVTMSTKVEGNNDCIIIITKSGK